ncbi:MAG: serine hydrolase [bacterium]
MSKTKIIIAILGGLILILLSNFLFGFEAFAKQNLINLNIDLSTVNKGYTINIPEENLRLGIQSSSYPSEISVKINKQDIIYENISGYKRTSPVFSYDIDNNEIVWPQKMIWVAGEINNNNLRQKNIAYFDNNAGRWMLAKGSVDYQNGEIRTALPFPYVEFAVFEKEGLSEPTMNSVSQPDIPAHGGIVIDVGSGKILYQKNIDDEMSLASLTKLITAKTFLNIKGNLDGAINYTAIDNSAGATIAFTNNESLNINDLFTAVISASANNGAKTLQRASGLNWNDFMGQMNGYITDLGLMKTKVYEVTGLNSNNQTTAREFAILATDAFSPKEILIASTNHGKYIQGQTTGRSYYIKNTNDLVAGKYYVNGSKTGYLPLASGGDGYNLAMSIKAAEGRNIIGVTLGSDAKQNSYNAMTTMFDFVLNNIFY